MTEELTFAGIDVAQAHLDVAIRPSREEWREENSGEGIDRLVTRLKSGQVDLVVLEATGGLETALVGELAEAGVPVAVVNPRQVRDFARALGQLAKTDTLDARVLAHFAEATRPEPRPWPEAQSRELQGLVTRRRQIVSHVDGGAESTQARSAAVQPRIQEHIDWLIQERDQLDLDLGDFLKGSPLWRVKEQLLGSVPGVGDVLKATLLANLPELAAWIGVASPPLVGVAPYNRDSGPGGGAVRCGEAAARCGRSCIWPPWWQPGSTQ